MKILDKYFLKKYLSTYFFVTFLIVLVILVIDFVEKNDNFIQNQAPLRSVIISYYFNLAPYWANYISPLMIFISTVFFTARLASHTEIVAILTSGVSYLRLMVPYLLGSLFVGLLTFAMIGWIIPKANKVRIKFENIYVKDHQPENHTNIHLSIAPNVYAYMNSYIIENQTGMEFTLEKFSGNRMVEKLKADRIVWNDSTHKWRIEEYTIRKLGVPDDRIIKGTAIDTVLAMSPMDFENDQSLYETFTLPELNDRISLIESRGSEGIAMYKIERYQRYASPFAVVILSLIGMILSSRKSRRGIAFQIAIGFLLAFTYLLFFILSKGLATGGTLSPIFAVWLPNIVYSFIGFVLFFTVPK